MEIFDGRYEQQQLLGKGAFSEVWKVRDTQTGVTLALKIYMPAATTSNTEGNDMLTHEFALMVNANHKNLLRPLFFNVCNSHPYLILPYCKEGNISKFIGKMSEEEAWKLLRDTASALAYLHGMNPPILHQDIKPANILLDDNGNYMLTDFGVSTQVKSSLSRMSNQDMDLTSAGTISYMAPERFSRNNLPIMANDIYSLGSTVFEMASGFLPFGTDGGLLQYKGAEIPELPGDFSPLLKKTLDDCLQTEPWQRPTAEQLEQIASDALQHPEHRNEVRTTDRPAPTILQIPEEYLVDGKSKSVFGANMRQTVAMSPADIAPKGTVIGTPAPHIGSSSDASVKSRSRLPIYLGILAVVAVIGVVVWLLFLKSSAPEENATQPLSAADIEAANLQMQEDAYRNYLAKFATENADSFKTAFNGMEALAADGYRDAVFQVAFTYAWCPKDAESTRRKKLLNWKLDANGLPDANVNTQAIKWLNQSIQVSDSTDYKSMYWLSFYYLNSIATQKDAARGLQLLSKAHREALRNADTDFAAKIADTQNTIKKQ